MYVRMLFVCSFLMLTPRAFVPAMGRTASGKATGGRTAFCCGDATSSRAAVKGNATDRTTPAYGHRGGTTTTTTTTYKIVSEDVLFWMDQDLRDPARRAAAWRRPCPCRVAHAARRMHTCSAHAL